jgi:hypothetical protein
MSLLFSLQRVIGETEPQIAENPDQVKVRIQLLLPAYISVRVVSRSYRLSCSVPGKFITSFSQSARSRGSLMLLLFVWSKLHRSLSIRLQNTRRYLRMPKSFGHSKNPSKSLEVLGYSFVYLVSGANPAFALRNMGAYAYVNPRIMTATREVNGVEKRPRYVGRQVSAAPATGVSRAHQVEYQEILDGVFGDPETQNID